MAKRNPPPPAKRPLPTTRGKAAAKADAKAVGGETLDALDSPGSIRKTRQRAAIRHVFERENRPLSPEETLERAERVIPGLGIATVYRAIKQFVQEGWLIPVQLPGEPARYEVAGKHHHHHFVCRECNSVFEIDGCPGNLNRFAPPGFVLEDHHLILYGRCGDCAG